MRRIYIFTYLLFFATLSIGQTNLESNMIFGGNSSDVAKDIKVNNTKTALFLGSRTFSNDGDIPENAGGSDYWIMKMNVDGTPIWSKTFGGLQDDDLEVVLPLPDGGTLGFGTTRTSQGLFGTLVGLTGGWLIRTNENGNIVDGKIFGGTITETAVDAVRHVNGNITMVLTAGSPILNGATNNGLLDIWIVQVNAGLFTEWSALIGGTNADMADAIATDAEGNLYIAGTSNSNLPGLPMNAGGTDLWILKLSPTGDILWQKTFGGSADESATDIIVHPDGNVYVAAHSASNDGDFDNNYGINDFWILKLNQEDGLLVDKFHYGGSSNDYDGKLDVFNDTHIVASISSTSSDMDLTGNKGFGDVWNFTIDLNGQITTQMNYGGSLSDVSGQIVIVDSIYHVFATTLSKDKNVPNNNITQFDTWYYTLNPNPDTCNGQLLCLPDSMLTNHLFPPANDALICVEGCTAGFGPGPFLGDDDCPDFDNATAYYYVTTDVAADLLTLSVTSDEFNRPQIGLFRSINCITFQPIECAVGEDGHVVMNYIEILPNSTYVVAISDMEGNIGDFEFCVTSIDVEFCNKNDRIFVTSTSMGSPSSGPFLPGEEVQVCYELRDWDKLECNGFQGVMPTFGPGWSSTSFGQFGEPALVDSMIVPATEGIWAWHKLGDVHYNTFNPVNGYEGGQGLPPGWYFTNTTNSPPATIPDETTGDLDDCLFNSDTWKVCFTLTVVDECETNLDCSIKIKTFADGEIGRNTSLACGYDQEEVFDTYMVCCINPSIDFIQDFSICSGDTLNFKPETNLLDPVFYSWTADPDPFAVGAASGNHLSQFYQILTNESVLPQTVRYSIKAENDDCETEFIDFQVTVFPRPTSRLTLSGPNIVCSGSTVRLNFESTGTPPFAIGLFKDNELFADVLSETTLLSIDIDPVFSGTFRIGTLQDANCSGSGTGTVNVTIKPVNNAQIDTTICEGESIIINNQTFSEPGTYTVVITGGGSNNCDSIVNLNLGVAPIITETIDEIICNGDTVFVLGVPYTETIDTTIEYIGVENCPNYINLHLLVMDTFSMSINQTICYGDTLDFNGTPVYAEGTYSYVEEIRPGCFEETVLNLSLLPEIFANDLSIMGDAGSNSGAILVEISGGKPPLSYLWSSGQTTESLFNIMYGIYTLTVTDGNGCDQEFVFEVPFISGSADLNQSEGVIKIWPTLLSKHDELQVINTASEPLQLRTIEWLSTNGHVNSSPFDIVLEEGQKYATKVPEQITDGIYFVKISMADDRSVWAKVLVID